MLLFKASIVAIGLLLPFVMVHELGHAAYCVYEGYEFDIGFNELGGYTICYGEIEHMKIYSWIGGLTSGILATRIACFVWKWKPLWIALASIACIQYFNAIIE